jgi:hypothetical protein
MSITSSEKPPSVMASLMQNNNVLGFLFMLPAAVFLVCFLTYPLGLGVWLGFTDTRIGRDGVFIGLENYEFLARDSVFWLSVFNTLLYTFVASAIKFGIGLYLALWAPFPVLLAAAALVELAWLWLRYQPDSTLAAWFRRRTQAAGSRTRKVMVVALARKLLVALWRFCRDGVTPEGAAFKTAVA